MSISDQGIHPRFSQLQDEVEAFLDKKLPAESRTAMDDLLMGAILEWLKDPMLDVKKMRKSIELQSQTLDRWVKLLPQVQEVADRWFYQQEQRERYSPAWWEGRKTSIYEAFNSATPERGIELWLKYFSQALMDWELETCKKLTDESFPFPDHASFIPQWMKSGIEAIQQENYNSALSMLTLLVNPGTMLTGVATPEIGVQAALMMLIGRIHLKDQGLDVAKQNFQAAHQLAPDTGLPYAGFGQYYQSQKDYNQATANFQQCVRLSPELTDGFAGMGVMFDEQGLWDESREWNTQAALLAAKQSNPVAALERLLAPTSGNLFLCLARELEMSDPELALQVVSRALQRGLRGAVSYPEASAYEFRGDLHYKLSHFQDAEKDYFEAGKRLSGRGELIRANEILLRARQLNQQDERICWYLADNFRQMVDTEKDKDKKNQLIKEGLQYWHKAEQEIRPPDREYYWAFLTRALLNEGWCEVNTPGVELRDQKFWEAQFFLERGWLIKPEEAYNWSYIARNYRNLNLPANTVRALERALQIDPKNLAALEEQLIHLTNIGQFDQALLLINQLRTSSDKSWLDNIQAYHNLYLENFEDTLKFSDPSFDREWTHDVRAYSFFRLGKKSEAIHEFEALLKYFRPEDVTTYASYALRKFHLAMLKGEGIATLQKELMLVQKASEDERTKSEALPVLALYLIADARSLDKAYKVYIDCIPLQRSRRDLVDLAIFNLKAVEFYSPQWTHHLQAVEIAEQIRRKVYERLETFQTDLMAPEEELLDQQIKFKENGSKGIVAWWAVMAGLGRLYLDEKRWEKAAHIYEELGNQLALIPEARLGLEKSAYVCLGEIETLLDTGQYNAAGQRAAAARSRLESTNLSSEIIKLWLKQGDSLFLAKRLEEARAIYETALVQAPSSDETKAQVQATFTERLDFLKKVSEGGNMSRMKPKISAAVPKEWFSKESITLLAPDGQANIISSSEPLDASIDAHQYAAVQGDLLRKEFPGFQEFTFEQTEVMGGHQGYVRRFEWNPPDGVPVTQIQLYYAENGRGYTATATTPSSQYERFELQLRLILNSLIINEK